MNLALSSNIEQQTSTEIAPVVHQEPEEVFTEFGKIASGVITSDMLSQGGGYIGSI